MLGLLALMRSLMGLIFAFVLFPERHPRIHFNWTCFSTMSASQVPPFLIDWGGKYLHSYFLTSFATFLFVFLKFWVQIMHNRKSVSVVLFSFGLPFASLYSPCPFAPVCLGGRRFVLQRWDNSVIFRLTETKCIEETCGNKWFCALVFRSVYLFSILLLAISVNVLYINGK